MPSETRSPRLAVLIDADNASAKSRMGCSRRLRRSGRQAFAASMAISPILALRAGPTRSPNTPSYLNSSLPTPPARMHPTSRWSSMQWTCFIAVGSMDFVWFPPTAISPALPPASASKASMCLGSGSRKLRRASGKPVEDSCSPRTCFRGAGEQSGCRLSLEVSSAPQRRHAHHQESHHTDGKRRRLGASRGSWKTACQPGFRLRSENLRLSQAERSGAKDKFIRDRCSKGGSMRIRTKPAAGSPPKSTTAAKTTT